MHVSGLFAIETAKRLEAKGVISTQMVAETEARVATQNVDGMVDTSDMLEPVKNELEHAAPVKV